MYRVFLFFAAVLVVSCLHIDQVCENKWAKEYTTEQTRTPEIAAESNFIQEVEQSIVSEGKISLGEFTITHYAIDERCCGKTDGITSTGTKAEVGRTIAVDPEVIPYGTKVEIDGVTYIAEDCGGKVKGNHIDILVASYDEAVSRGKITREVFLKGETNEN